jgi:2-desacetyl-2-hydroxyethyl bacteriochlorophyllide A dehydrogenase
MRALTWRGVHELRLETVPDPVIQDPHDALVRVERAGICGSDLHVYHGREPGLDPGTVMGHELVGRVTAAGPAVTRFALGDRVVAPFSTCCGRCFYCARGLTARCSEGRLFGWVQNGAGLHGAQAEQVRVPLADATLVAVPDDLPLESALLLADVLPTGWHGARAAGIGPGQVAVVLGCGPVGLMSVACARERGATTVFAVDAVPERLDVAVGFGAAPLLPDDDAPRLVRRATDGRGADAVIEAVGSPAALQLAFALVRPGGIIAVVGVHHEAQFGFSPLQAYERNLTLTIGRCPARAVMEEVMPLLRRRPELGAIITHRRPLALAIEAYALFDRRQDGCIKVVLEP